MAINPFSNAGEDFIDELTTILVMDNTKKVFDPLKKDLEGNNETAFNEALSSAIATLQMGISMLAIQYVTSSLAPYLYKRAGAYYTYIIAGKVGKGIASRIRSSRLGSKAKRKLLGALFDTTEQRTERAKIANDLISHVDNMQLQKEKISNDSRIGLQSSFMNADSNYSNKNLALYTEKTKSGTWKKTQQDRKIYEKATGKKLDAGVTWGKMVEKLNSFSEFAISAEGKIINLAQTQLDTFTASGSSKVG